MGAMPSLPAPEQHEGNPVTVNVNMNASGKEHVADLLDMMKNAGMGAAEPVSAKMLSPRMDMERLSGIMDAPESIEEGDDDMMNKLRSMSEDDILAQMELGGPMKDFIEKLYNQVSNKMGMGDMDAYDFDSAAPNFDKVHAGVMKMLGADAKNEGDYANEPDAQYGDMSDAIPDGNDLNRKKKAYAATQDGDNPMAVEAIKATLMAALQEKKAKPDFLDVDKDGDKKEPMKKALKDKGSKPKKGVVPPQFKKK
jgi:hypothetical protein